MNRWLGVLLARLRPARGRHTQVPGTASDDTVVFPRITDAEGVSPSDLTMLDCPPLMPRPYVKPPDDPD